MSDIGKVKEYNGYYGTIINQSGEEYLLLKEQIVPGEVIRASDNVTFVPEVYKKSELEEKVARFVKKLVINRKEV